MRFIGFREFKTDQFVDSNLQNVIKYLTVDLVASLRELTNGLGKLSFLENFTSFQVSVTIAAGTELAIRNELDSIPTQRIIVRSNSSDIVDGDTDWDLDFVYLKNTGGSSAEVTAVFLK